MSLVRNTVTGPALEERLRAVIQSLEELHRRVSRGCLLSQGNLTLFTTPMQAKSSLDWHDPIDQLVYSIVIDHCVRAEKAGPGSFHGTLSLILNALRGSRFDPKQHDFDAIIQSSFVPTYEQLVQMLNQHVNNDFVVSLLLETLETSGLEGKVFFETSDNETLSIEQVNGFNFQVEFPFPVVLVRKRARVLVVDGFIEAVSEVHHLLQKLSETKEPMVFVARGFANDVISTMKVNLDRKTLEVVPVAVKFDFAGVNTLADIATVCGTDVVSSAKGQLISTIGYDSIAIVPAVSCSGTTLTITNDSTVSQAGLQVQKLLDRRLTAPLDDLANLYDARIKSLTPRCTKVRVPGDRRLSEYTELFDVGLRLIRSAIKRGMTWDDGLQNTQSTNDPRLLVTVEAALARLRYTRACLQSLSNVSALIV